MKATGDEGKHGGSEPKGALPTEKSASNDDEKPVPTDSKPKKRSMFGLFSKKASLVEADSSEL